MATGRQHKGAAILPAESKAGNKYWADLFKENSKPGLLRKTSMPSSTFQLRNWNADDRVIAKEDLRNLGFCLVGYVLGRFPGRSAIDNVRRSWNVDSSCSLHENGWLIFRFSNEQDRDSVLMNGPYESSEAPWLLKKLPQFFKFNGASFSSIPTWIRLQGLPLECWTENALGKLASFVGEPLAADECTATMSKTSFARILVEVDLNKPLVREISTCLPDGSLLLQKVTYEREPMLCSKCKRIGHTQSQCRSIMKAQQNTASGNLHLPKTRTEDNVMMEMQSLRPSGAVGSLEREMQLSSAKGAEGGDAVSQDVAVELALLRASSSTQADHLPSDATEVQDLISAANKDLAEPLQAAAATHAEMHTQRHKSEARQNHCTHQATKTAAKLPAGLSPPQQANKKQQLPELQASSSSAANLAAVLVSPQPAMKMQHVVDLQGTLARPPADPIGAFQLQNQGHESAAMQHLNVANIPATLQTPVKQREAAASQLVDERTISQVAKTGQTRRLTRASVAQSSDALAKSKEIAVVPTHAMDLALQVDALEAEPSSLVGAQQQQQQRPGQQQQQQRQQQQQQQQQRDDESGQSMLQTKNASAMRVQQLQHGSAASQQHGSAASQQHGADQVADTYDLLHADPAEVISGHSAAVPKLQTNQHKWETRRTKSGKKRR